MPLIDTDKVLAKLYLELEDRKTKVRETEVKIEHVKELAQMVGVIISTNSTKSTNIPKGTDKKKSLTNAIIGLLEERKEWLSTVEIAEELSKQGFEEKSKSGDFKMYVITSVPKLWKRKNPKIARIEGPGGIKYGALDLNKPEVKEENIFEHRN